LNKINEEQLNHALKKAVEFHGHLGPFLVIGVKMGLLGRNTFNGKYSVEVRTQYCPPLSCVIDGIQISTGSTIGNGGLTIKDSEDSDISVYFKGNGKVLKILLKNEIKTTLLEECENVEKEMLEKIGYQIIETPVEKMFLLE